VTIGRAASAGAQQSRLHKNAPAINRVDGDNGCPFHLPGWHCGDYIAGSEPPSDAYLLAVALHATV
jgi:hypothetical protein